MPLGPRTSPTQLENDYGVMVRPTFLFSFLDVRNFPFRPFTLPAEQGRCFTRHTQSRHPLLKAFSSFVVHQPTCYSGPQGRDFLACSSPLFALTPRLPRFNACVMHTDVLRPRNKLLLEKNYRGLEWFGSPRCLLAQTLAWLSYRGTLDSCRMLLPLPQLRATNVILL